MKQRSAIYVTMIFSMLCSCRKDRGANAQPNSALRAELLQRYAVDQQVRTAAASAMRAGQMPADSVLRAMTQVDSSNTLWLKEQVAKSGWPTRAVVDSDGVTAAFMLLQHADNDTTFQAQVLPLLERAYHDGEFPGSLVALLSDRMAEARGQLQEYGTQADIRNNHVYFKPIRDSANVDARRKKMNLPPLQTYLYTLDSAYFGRMHN